MGTYAGVVGGIGTMMSVRERPWHYESNKDRVRLVEHNVTSGAQALTLAGIDWKVERLGLDIMTGGVFPHAEDFVVTLRSDTRAVLGVHSKAYGVIQNTAVGEMADAIMLTAPGSYVDTAGSLYEPGKVIWMLVRLGEASRSLDSRYEQWLLISTSHDGSKAFTCRFVRVRVVCMNTFSMAMHGSKVVYSVRHTSNAEGWLGEAREAVGMALTTSAEMDKAIEKMLSTPLGADEFVGSVVPKVLGDRPMEESNDQTTWDRQFAEIVSAYGSDHNAPIVGTTWAGVNAVQEAEQWGGKPRDLGKSQMTKVLNGDWPRTRKALALLAPS